MHTEITVEMWYVKYVTRYMYVSVTSHDEPWENVYTQQDCAQPARVHISGSSSQNVIISEIPDFVFVKVVS